MAGEKWKKDRHLDKWLGELQIKKVTSARPEGCMVQKVKELIDEPRRGRLE